MTVFTSVKRVSTIVLATSALTLAGVPALADVGPWVTQGSDRANPTTESQGLATVVRSSGTSIRYTGFGTIPSSVSSRGWNHVGDPGSRQGYYIEPYQSDTISGKMFRVEAPNGTITEYTHALVSGELYNNSFDAVSPDGNWMVSGEWGGMTRLLVFPTPGIRFTTPGSNLPLTSAIRLDAQVSDIQGCEFSSSTRLLCSSDGSGKPLVQVDLSAALSGTDVTGHVTNLGSLPQQSSCSGNFETEGIDYNTADGTLRVIMMSPGICVAFDSKTWRFKHN